jgi:hypothetical protein
MFNDFDGMLGGLVDAEMAKDAGKAAGGGALAAAVHAAVTDMIRRDVKPEDTGADGSLPTGATGKMPMFGTPGRKMIAAAVVGVAGGFGLWQVDEDAAKGAVGAMGAEVTNGLYDMLFKKRTVRVSVPEIDQADRTTFDKIQNALQLDGFAGALASATPSFAGYLNDADVFNEDPHGGAFADAEVEDEDMFGSIDAIAASY